MNVAAIAQPTRIVYGACCVWWDSIDKAGKTAPRDGISLPCCPHCGGVLFETNPDQWWAGVDRHEAAGHPGYRTFVEWSRGKCFRTFLEAKAAYETEGKSDGLSR